MEQQVTILIDDELFTIDESGELLEATEWWQRGDEPPEVNAEHDE